MSLTTAISDEEDIESNRASPYKMKSGGSAASFNCTGAVRKAGFLSVKKWLLRKKHQVFGQNKLDCITVHLLLIVKGTH